MRITHPSTGDVIAGISVALLALPQGLAYAELALSLIHISEPTRPY